MSAPRPWWADCIPDTRGLATIGIFMLAAYGLHLVADNPKLAGNDLFKTVIILLFGTGGFGLCCSFLWGGTKVSAQAAETVNQMAKSASPNPPPTDTPKP